MNFYDKMEWEALGVAAAHKVCKELGVNVSDTSPGALEKMRENYKLIGEEIIRMEEKYEVI